VVLLEGARVRHVELDVVRALLLEGRAALLAAAEAEEAAAYR